MRYLRVVEEQGRYVASLPEVPQPTPARGEVLIQVTASGVNRADLSQIAGRYPPPPGESEILGLEVSGTLVETGEPVAATTLSADKLTALEAVGADLAIDTSRRDFAAEIEQRWGRDAVDVVLDPVGASTLPSDIRVLKTGGRIVVLSTMSGSEASLDLALLMRKRARIVGSTLRARSRAEKATIVSRFKDEILPGFATGALRVVVDAVFPVARAAEAFQRMRENRNVGKILIAWRSD